jgi:hypothetical protein
MKQLIPLVLFVSAILVTSTPAQTTADAGLVSAIAKIKAIDSAVESCFTSSTNLEKSWAIAKPPLLVGSLLSLLTGFQYKAFGNGF